MHWAYPNLTWLCAATCGITALAVLGVLRKARALRRLAPDPGAQPVWLVRRPLQVLKVILVIAAADLLAVVILGPQWGRIAEDGPPLHGRDVLVVLDVSRSMLAEDVPPSRLERAKADVRDLAASLEREGGYRIGLIAFADRATLLCPLTMDFRCFDEELLRASLGAVRLRGDVGSADGTQIGTALRRAALAIAKGQAEFTDVVLLSDGGDMEPDSSAASDELAKLGVRVHAVGYGDPGQASPIPLKGPSGTRTYLQYRGETVRTKLEEDVLRDVARRTQGHYLAAGTGYLELDRVFADVLADRPTREMQPRGADRLWPHRFQWFLAPAVVLLVLELLLRDGRRANGKAPQKAAYFGWVRRKNGLNQNVDSGPSLR